MHSNVIGLVGIIVTTVLFGCLIGWLMSDDGSTDNERRRWFRVGGDDE